MLKRKTETDIVHFLCKGNRCTDIIKQREEDIEIVGPPEDIVELLSQEMNPLKNAYTN